MIWVDTTASSKYHIIETPDDWDERCAYTRLMGHDFKPKLWKQTLCFVEARSLCGLKRRWRARTISGRKVRFRRKNELIHCRNCTQTTSYHLATAHLRGSP